MTKKDDIETHRVKEREKFLALVKTIDDPILMVLRVHLYAEHLFERIISCKLPRGDKLFNKSHFSFSQKLAIVSSFDFVEDDLLTSIKHLNSTRNKCAHDLHNKISLAEIDRIGRPFGKNYSKIRRENIGDDLKTLLSVCIRIGARLALFTIDTEKEAHEDCE